MVQNPVTPSVCSHCGHSLSAPHAVCPHCEQELGRVHTFMDGVTLAASSQADSEGPHVCPWGGWRFQAPVQVAVAPGTPWHKPADLCPQCPHCQGWLQDTRTPTLRWTHIALLCGLAALCGHYARRYHPFLQPTAVLLVAAALWWMYRRYHIRREKEHPQPRRYARWQGQAAGHDRTSPKD